MATKRKIGKRASTRKRKAATAAPVQLPENINDVRSLLKVLRDGSKPIDVRMAALQSLGAALESEHDRAGVYLTNALTGWEPVTTKPLPFPELEEERPIQRSSPCSPAGKDLSRQQS